MPSASSLKAVFRQEIEADSQAAPTAVYALAQIGTTEDRGYLTAKLDTLHQKDTAGYSEEDGRLEVEFVDALIHGRTWDFGGIEAKQIAEQNCRSAECRTHFQLQRRRQLEQPFTPARSKSCNSKENLACPRPLSVLYWPFSEGTPTSAYKIILLSTNVPLH
jgi:hypothetical protein